MSFDFDRYVDAFTQLRIAIEADVELGAMLPGIRALEQQALAFARGQVDFPTLSEFARPHIPSAEQARKIVALTTRIPAPTDDLTPEQAHAYFRMRGNLLHCVLWDVHERYVDLLPGRVKKV